MRNLENRLNQSLEGTLPANSLTDLTRYLSYFTAVADTCPLEQILQQQLQGLMDITLRYIFSDNEELMGLLDDSISLECMRNTTLELIKDYHSDVLPPMERQLHDLGQFVRALKYADYVRNMIRLHDFSDSCMTALVRMQYCSVCGGYGRFRPCLNLCMNTLRGCFADVVEVQQPFLKFTKLLRTLSVSIINDFKPDRFVDKNLKQLVGMVEYLKENENALEKKVSWIGKYFVISYHSPSLCPKSVSMCIIWIPSPLYQPLCLCYS